MIIFVLGLILIYSLFSQDSINVAAHDSSQTDSLISASFDNGLFFRTDTLALQLSYPINKKLPKNIISIPSLPSNLLEVDVRTGSYYTPKIVQDKLDQIMNRPRSDSFSPVLAMAVFAASIAVKQLGIEKLFELDAEDYLVPEDQFMVLEKLWAKAPRRIDNLYLLTELKNGTTAKELQKSLQFLADKGLVKTRDAGENNILFFPAQKRDKVLKLFRSALNDTSNSEETQAKLNYAFEKLQKIVSEKPAPR